MRAWLLLLAVLATFHTSVQVASTEDITSRFITAILPVVEPRNRSVLVIEKTTTKASSSSASTSSNTTPSALMQRSAKSKTTNALATSPASTALAGAFSSSGEISEYQSYPPTPTSVSVSSPTSKLTSKSISTTTDANSESDKIMSNNIVTDNVIIEIKNYKEIEGKYTSSSEQVKKPHRTNQSEVAKTIQNQTSIKQLKNSHNKPNEQVENQQQTNSAVQVQLQETSENNVQQEQQNTEAFSFTTATTTNTHTNIPTSSASSLSSTAAAIDSAPAIAASNSAHDDVSNSGSNSKSIVDDSEIHEDEGEPATYSNKEIIGQKMEPDPSTLVEIENSLLSLFNMKRPPKIDRSKIVIPEAMRKLYDEIMGNEVDSVNIPKPGLLTKSANTVRSFTHQDSKIDDRFPHHHRFRLHFDISSIPAEEKLKAAELQLTRDAVSHTLLNARQTNRTRYQVLIYDITRVGVRGKREPNYLLLDTKTVRLNSTETVSLDVQPAVDRWLASPKKNYGLLVEVRTMRSLKPAPHHHVRLRRSADEPHSNWQHKQPLLFTYTDDGRHKSRSIRDMSPRSKRAGHKRTHRRKNTEENCRRHSLYVDFTDVGWSDWIVAPPGYDAYYCHGKCPFPLAEHLNSTNHAVVQTLVNNIHQEKVPMACCVPTQLEGISMLYLNDQRTVVLKNYQDMTVVGCGCR